jgi:DNA-binding NarL/FixJ family response regulator
MKESYAKEIMFDFTKEEYEELKDKLMLNDELSKILEMKIKGCSIIEISTKLNLSERAVNRRVKKLKE